MTTAFTDNDILSMPQKFKSELDNEDSSSTEDLLLNVSSLWAQAISHLKESLWYLDDKIDKNCLYGAIKLAEQLEQYHYKPPSSVVVDEDGEVAFEWRNGQSTQIIEVMSPNVAEYFEVVNCKVVDEYDIPLNDN